MDKIINLLINNWTKGVDTYTHNGSTWLIFTEQRSWVIELTECKTLWYNYNFFKELFSLTSMDVVDNQHYITKWVEDNIIGGVKYTSVLTNVDFGELEEAIQNGVKRTVPESIDDSFAIEDTIQNGVKETQFNSYENKSWVEGVIKKGIKETNHVDVMGFFNNKMEDALQNGVRHTLNTEYMPKTMVEDIIENGVKETKGHGFEQQNIIDDIVKDGVKEIKTPNKDGDIVPFAEWMKENNSSSYTKMIDDVIDNGVKKTMLRQHITDGNVDTIIETGIKEVQPLPDQSGELIGYGNYYHGKEDRTKAFYNYLEDTIKFGVKET